MLRIANRTVSTVAVIGSGQIGPDIALHFAKVLQAVGGRVVVIDISDKALQAGQARVWKKIDKGAETGAWKPAQAEQMKALLHFTPRYEDAKDADLVVEAATEDEGLKGRIFRHLEGLCRPEAVFLSNSSHLEPERIFATLEHRGRTAVAHYFFPAERNPVVEIVRGPETDPALADWLVRFYEAIGKIPIPVKSQYGYAADPIFEGLFQAACQAVEEGLGTVKEVDFVARGALGMTVGPFTAMNLTGGNPITQHGLGLMHTRLQPWFRSPKLLDDLLTDAAVENRAPLWQVCSRGETVTLPPEQEQRIVRHLRGAYLGLCFAIYDTGIVALSDYELCLELALDIKPPCRLAAELGLPEALRLVEAYAKTHPDFPVPRSLKQQAESGEPFALSNLVLRDVQAPDGQTVRVVQIRRPKVLNALNHETYHQIAEAVDQALQDPHVSGVVLTGHGSKAFVSGADIHALRAIRTPDDGYAIAKLGQDVARRIEKAGKPVVAALNGLAFGGGLELAMGCHARVAVAGQKVLAGQPEVNLGIIPAAGGTQRLTRLVGLEAGSALLRTGNPVGSDQALELGLVQALAPADRVVDEAVALVADVVAGRKTLTPMVEAPIAPEVPKLPAVDIAHRSTRVDALLQEAIAWGAAHTLEQGLDHELEVFKQVCELQDMRIGVEHFVKHGPRTPAPFVHG